MENKISLPEFKALIEKAGSSMVIPSESIVARNVVVADLGKIVQVTNQEEQDFAIAILTSGKKIIKDVEAVRKEMKDPVNALGNIIQKLAADFSQPLQSKMEEKLGLVRVFQTAEAERVRKEEEKRQADIREALRLEEESKRKLEETQRQAALLLAQPSQSDQPDADGASDLGSLMAQEEVSVAAEVVQQSSSQVVALINSAEPEKAKSKGLSSRMVWKHEVTDTAKAYAAHPEFFKIEPRSSVITAAKSKRDFECPGIRFWEEAAPSLRA